MAGTDVKDKPIGDSSVTDNRDEQWSDDDQQAYDAEYEKQKQQQNQSSPQKPKAKNQGQRQGQGQGKSKARQRYEEWKEKTKDKAKKKVQEYAKKKAKKYAEKAAKKLAKKAAKEAAKTAAKEGIKQGAVAAASLAGSEVPVVGNIVVGAAAEVAVEGAEIGYKVVKEGVHVATHIEEITKEPGKFVRAGWKWWKWVFWGIGLFIILLIIFALIIGGVADQLIAEEEAAKAAGNPLVFSKTCVPPNIPNLATNVTCTLTATYPGSAQDIIIEDDIPPNAEFVSSPQAHTDITAGARVTSVQWSAKALAVDLTASPLTFTVEITIKPLSGQRIYNIANTTVFGGSLAGGVIGAGGYVSPSTNDCGKYAASMNRNWMLHQNFGDPLCNFDKDQLFQMLQQLDPSHANIWFTSVIPCESGFNPTTWRDPNARPATPDAGGAWGLFQIGSSAVAPNSYYGSNRSQTVTLGVLTQLPGLAPPAVGHSKDPYDRGDVNWQLQVTNAVNLLQGRGSGYWGCWP